MPETRKGRRRAAVTAAATAAIAPLAVPAIAPDSAAASPPHYCPGNTICLYEGSNFSQSIAYFNPAGKDLNYSDNRFVDGSPLNENVSAIWNNSRSYVTFCENANCDIGWNFCLAPGVASGNLILYNNGISAHFTTDFEPALCQNKIHGPQGCSL
jgi:Pyruvate/2-oxoacid:ferredoxin oxidoreductase delta subunit